MVVTKLVQRGRLMEHLPLETQTLYAQRMESVLAMEAQRSIGRLSGCFTTKTVKGLDEANLFRPIPRLKTLYPDEHKQISAFLRK